jgi:O-antigen/teichoic acid export membrane protein
VPAGSLPAERDLEARVAPGELGTRVSRGLAWSLMGQAVSRVGVFAAGIALARLLAPIDMGEVAAALLVVNVAMAINELGVIPALVRTTGNLREASATATTVAALNSSLVYIATFMLAPYVAAVTNTPGSVWVIRIMSLTVLVDGAIAVPLAMLYRQLRTVVQTVAEVVGMAVYVAASVGLASMGIDANAIAWGRVLGAIATGAVIVGVSWWPARPAFDVRVARELLRYGAPLAASAALFEAVMSIDYLIVGRELAGAALGVYLLAFNLSSWPVSILSVAIGRVSFAGYSALLGERDRFLRGVRHSLAVALSCTVPMVLVLIVIAPDLVDVVYGTRWIDAVAPLRWLLVIGGLRVLLQLVGELIAVLGRTRRVLRLRCIWLLLLPVALDAGAERSGLVGVGVAHVAVALIVMVPLFLRELRLSGVPVAPLAPILVRPAAGAIAALVAMTAASWLVEPAFARIVVLGAVGTATYAAVLVPGNPVITTLRRQLRGGLDAAPTT